MKYKPVQIEPDSFTKTQKIIEKMEKKVKPGKFELFKGKNGQWYFNLKASNGKVIATSEGYKKKAMAEHGIMSVRRNAPSAPIKEK